MAIKYDNHYTELPIQPIDVMEQIVAEPSELSPKQALNVAQAAKYILRAGRKEGEGWDKDIIKAINFLNRALTGGWYE